MDDKSILIFGFIISLIIGGLSHIIGFPDFYSGYKNH